MIKRTVARWEVRGGKRFIVLYQEFGYYFYRGDGVMGSIGGVMTDEEAIAWMERPWPQAGPATVLKTDFPSLRRVRI